MKPEDLEPRTRRAESILRSLERDADGKRRSAQAGNEGLRELREDLARATNYLGHQRARDGIVPKEHERELQGTRDARREGEDRAIEILRGRIRDEERATTKAEAELHLASRLAASAKAALVTWYGKHPELRPSRLPFARHADPELQAGAMRRASSSPEFGLTAPAASSGRSRV